MTNGTIARTPSCDWGESGESYTQTLICLSTVGTLTLIIFSNRSTCALVWNVIKLHVRVRLSLQYREARSRTKLLQLNIHPQASELSDTEERRNFLFVSDQSGTVSSLDRGKPSLFLPVFMHFWSSEKCFFAIFLILGCDSGSITCFHFLVMDGCVKTTSAVFFCYVWRAFL